MAKWKVKDLLNLVILPEDRQKIWLAASGVINFEGDEKDVAYLTESLAETAFRLKDEVIKDGCDWLSAVCEVITYCEGEILCETCHQTRRTKKYFDWGKEAQPIHWIIAALIAEVRKEEEIESGKTL